MIMNLVLDGLDRTIESHGFRIIRYADLCRCRHKSAYAEFLIMPSWRCECL
jgi:hypothetical protein